MADIDSIEHLDYQDPYDSYPGDYDPLPLPLDEKGVPTQERAERQANKIAYATEGGIGVDEAYYSLVTGDYERLQNVAAWKKRSDDLNTRMNIIGEYAKAAGPGGLTEEHYKAIEGLSVEQLVDKRTVLEKMYGEKVMRDIIAMDDNPDIQAALREAPDQANMFMDEGVDKIQRREIIQKWADIADSAWDREGLVSKGGDIAKMMIPTYSEFARYNTVPGKVHGGLPGKNIQEQRAYLMSLPPDQLDIALGNAISNLSDGWFGSALEASNWINSILEFSDKDAMHENFWAATTAVDLGISAGALKGIQAIRRATIKGAQAVAKKEPKIGTILEETGNLSEAVSARAPGILAQEDELLSSKDPTKQIKALMDQAPMNMNPTRVAEGTAQLENPMLVRVLKRLKENAALLKQAVITPGVVNRLTPEAWAKAVEITKKELADMFRSPSHGVLKVDDAVETVLTDKKGNKYLRVEKDGTVTETNDPDKIKEALAKKGPQKLKTGGFEVVEPTESITGVGSVTIKMGRPDGTLFGTSKEAFNFAKTFYNIADGFDVRPEGNGYAIRVTKDVRENDAGVLDLLINTNNRTDDSLVNMFLGRWRTPDDVVGKMQRDNRNAALLISGEMKRLVQEVVDNMPKLKDKGKALSLIMDEDRDFVTTDPVTKEATRGRTHDTIESLENAFLQHKSIKRLPTEKEVEAYFTMRQLHEFDYMRRNLNAYRDKAILGTEQFKIERANPAGGEKPFFFEGIKRDNIPFDDGIDANVALFDPDGNELLVFNKNIADGGVREQVKKMLDEGYQVIELHSPNLRPLQRIMKNDDIINFALVKNPTRKRLSTAQVGNRSGWHVTYADQKFIKQAKMRKGNTTGKWYLEGDTSALVMGVEKQGQEALDMLEGIRKLLKDGKRGTQEYLDALEKSPWNDAWVKRQFFDIPEGKQTPNLDINSPFVMTHSGEGVNDVAKDMLRREFGDYVDTLDSPYNSANLLNKKYLGQRDLALPSMSTELGSEGNPIYSLTSARYIDPWQNMNDALSNVIRSSAFDDYKISAANSWVEQFSGLVKGWTKDQMRANPILALHEAPLDTSRFSAKELAAAKATRQAIANLIGTPSEMTQRIQLMTEKFINSVYTNLGENAAKHVLSWDLHKVRDPFKFFRSFAFHTKLGMFNPVQFFTQAQTILHASAIVGDSKIVYNGLTGYWFNRSLGFTNDPKMLEAAAERAAKMGWKKEDFIESHNELRKSGLMNVSGEVATLDDYGSPKIVRSAAGKLLDKGTFFFSESERMVRTTAWNMAYQEWKKANPSKKLSVRDRNTILTRTMDLTGNMTRASNATWQQGLMSIPTQFFGYQVRLMEQFLGKRLTGAEKARAFSMYSLMYGLPVGLGAVTGGLPLPVHWYEDIKEEGYRRGIEFADNIFTDGLIHGLPAMFINQLTGKKYDISAKGPGGLNVFKQVMEGDKTITDVLIGAGGNIFGSAVKASVPIMQDIYYMMDNDADSPASTDLVIADILEATREISTIGNMEKAYMAMVYGKYWTKNGLYVNDDMNTMDGLLMSFVGINNREIPDTFAKMNTLKHMNNAKKEVGKEWTRFFRKSIEARKEGDDSQAHDYARKALTLWRGMDLTPMEKSKLFQDSVRGFGPLQDNIDWQYKQKLKGFED